MTKMLKASLRNSLLPTLLICVAAAAISSEAPAKSTSKADKSIATKKGVEGSLGQKEIDEDKLPGKLEIGIALGSVAGMIAAIKYL